MRRLTKRFLVDNLDNINLSSPIRYERYYINNLLRIQSKNGVYEKEILNDDNEIIEKVKIDNEEFNSLKKKAYREIIRDSFLVMDDSRISIKVYYGDFSGLNRVEVSFSSEEEMLQFQKTSWMGNDITNSQLAFDKDLSKLSKEEFEIELLKNKGRD